MKKQAQNLDSLERADLALALAVLEAGSLSGAARALSLEPPAVSKKLANLEARLGFQLFHRSTRRLQISSDGEAFVRHAREVLAAFTQLADHMLDRHSSPRGHIRLACSFGFGRHVLAPLLAGFQAAHPLIQIQLQLVDRLPDLVAEGFDAAVWLWSPSQSSLRVQTLARNHRVLVAAPAYLERAGAPKNLQELTRHPCLAVREGDQQPALWALQPLGRKGPAAAAEAVSVRIAGPLSSNSGEVVRDWALAGHGIMLRSRWDVHGALRRGELVQVLPGWGMQDADVQWVLPPRAIDSPLPQRLRRLQEHLTKALRTAPWNKPAA
jgi:LysR family transcriptional regulator, transcriptional activator for dmlA